MARHSLVRDAVRVLGISARDVVKRRLRVVDMRIQADIDAVVAEGGAEIAEHLLEQARAVLRAAAVPVSACVDVSLRN
jgi:hypothetical protein